MDPKETETQRKMKALAAYIQKQLGSGIPPKELYADLTARKVPHKLAVEMIEAERARQNAPDIPQPEEEPAATDSAARPNREDNIRAFINEQADAGKTVDQIHKMLIERDVSHQQAADLIQQETRLVISPQDEGNIPAALAVDSPPDVLPPIENKWEMEAYARSHLNSGKTPKELVEALVEGGIERNAAIDVVMDAKEKQDLELREIAANPEGLPKAELAKRGMRNMLIGGALFFGGIFITVVTYSLAEEGGTYWFLYGPIIIGLITGIMGLMQWLRNQ